ncbi:unnamed protein product [Rotaria socialis]|uniref:Uncharacterized protein n=1 Tax=Rotaria socialis TaxID=392032 RepID=A0A817W5C7_9BILA|nr:unnamed protein product [Rotaria socialis]
MGYDRQRSPFATRLILTCYCLFLLINVLLYSNEVYRRKKGKHNFEYQFETISLGFIGLFIFSISFYGLWFPKIFILCFVVLLLFLLLVASLITAILIIIKIEIINSNTFLSLKNSFYLIHNYIWLTKTSTVLLRIINLSISCLLNIFSILGIYHLCSCIEYTNQSSIYGNRISRTSQSIT